MSIELFEFNSETKIYRENKVIIENKICKSIDPYIDSLSFFTKIDTSQMSLVKNF